MTLSPLWLLASGGLLSLSCFVWVAYVIGERIGFHRGYERGQEVASMEPPVVGEFHFRDGDIITTYADSPTEALRKLTRYHARELSAGGPLGGTAT